ncbi:MAG TPA: PSD1 and planctomycete cytochrome C domain-containing protein [Bryobacteraceae bacterium]|nr:PSD1 and planctomycete cytochrome C domain-containing protein [Bryobacteraceae bacterium]
MSRVEKQAFRTLPLRAAVIAALLAIPASAQRAPLFKSEILPVLEKNCVQCHGDQKKMAGLDLSTFAGLMAGGSSGPVIAPGKPERSLLWQMIDSGKMPMAGKLTDADKQLIRTYIEQGRFPSMEAAQQEREAAKITLEVRNWWSFRKPVDSAVPSVKHSEQVKTPIDAFVLAKLEAKAWQLQPEADRVTLIRRAYLDLTGLPPSPAEVKAFAEDKSADAYEKLVDRLLASPHYGEQWGRHWLDVAGYSDSVGDAYDTERVAAWKYRDYVINAFNKNKPYNRFLMEQFAGDQLVNYDPGKRPAPEQIEPLIATGFLRTTADITDNQTIYQVDKYFDALEKSTETSLKAVMGLTVQCARCHDHKFDPLLQRDYYKLTAVFQAAFDPENWLAANLHYGEWPSRVVLDMQPDQRDTWIKAVTSNTSKERRRQELLLAATYDRYRKELKTGKQLTPEEREAIRKEIAADPDLDVDPNAPKDGITEAELEKRFPELAEKKAEIQAMRYKGGDSKVQPNYILATWDVSKTPSPTYILQRGNYLAPGAAVEPGIPAVLDDPQHPFRFPDPKQHPEWHHTGRRQALAEWLTQPDNPLTARVFVNRVWQFHFGEGIVRSVDDFGSQGMPPTHPELLDWLAVRFVEHGWDIKWLTKEIMMSAVYRQSSVEDPVKMAADPSDKLLWRKAPIRLEAEVIRDSMLKVSGLLNPEMFGPQLPLKQADDGQWLEDEKKINPNRRSMYLSFARTRPEGFLHAFDCPDMTSDSQSQRFRSALPAQSLALLNNALVRRTSLAFTEQVLERSKGNAEDALELAFDATYSRKPYPEELELARKVMSSSADPKEGLRLFLQGLMAANDFLYSF